jgi:hypothetical protein
MLLQVLLLLFSIPFWQAIGPGVKKEQLSFRTHVCLTPQ